ncbi:unnamed protein product [Enterobius vermicularis]|uniref:SERPIN domain-containing protein n=1 Tax=Enterobius vermicularis TaxID=51028 RepID=A0A0N4UZY8_ENTVE|nr:unnamed protein product [Enterobius vermicularis]
MDLVLLVLAFIRYRVSNYGNRNLLVIPHSFFSKKKLSEKLKLETDGIAEYKGLEMEDPYDGCFTVFLTIDTASQEGSNFLTCSLLLLKQVRISMNFMPFHTKMFDLVDVLEASSIMHKL